jgi:hypothetical protein
MKSIKTVAIAACITSLMVTAAQAKQASYNGTAGESCKITFANGGYIQGVVVDHGTNCYGAYYAGGKSQGSAITAIPVRSAV